MRLFKHGEVLAVVIPEHLRKKLGLVEGSEFEFYEVEPGLLCIATPTCISENLKQTILSRLLQVTTVTTVQKQPSSKKAELLMKIKQAGLITLTNEFEARKIAEELSEELKIGNLIGTRTSEHFYFISKEHFSISAKKVKAAIVKDCNIEEIALNAKTSKEEANAVINVLKEQGEILEKTKGKYTLI